MSGQTVQVAFVFASGGRGTDPGWYVDDISLAASSMPVVPPVLAVVTSAQPSTGSFQLTFNTDSNTTWRIDASTNLSSWLPLLTNTAGSSGTIQFTDLLATNYPCAFIGRFRSNTASKVVLITYGNQHHSPPARSSGRRGTFLGSCGSGATASTDILTRNKPALSSDFPKSR